MVCITMCYDWSYHTMHHAPCSFASDNHLANGNNYVGLESETLNPHTELAEALAESLNTVYIFFCSVCDLGGRNHHWSNTDLS